MEQTKLRQLSKRGQVSGMVSQVLSIIVLVIVLVLGLVIVQELRDTQTAGTEAYTSANESLVGLATVSDFIPIIVLAVIASVVIALILVGFAFSRSGR
jgi:heme/copper-type cytochrome/quinol oxidase subunit 2